MRIELQESLGVYALGSLWIELVFFIEQQVDFIHHNVGNFSKPTAIEFLGIVTEGREVVLNS